MKDRIPKYAGRVKLNPVPNQPNTYDMERADEPLQEGTPLNKNTLLSDDIALKMGLKDDDTPNDALQSLFEKGNNILKKGKGDHSIEQVSEKNTNQALTENTIALGEGCIAGCKGYYITGIFFGNEQYYPQVRISNVQPNSIDILKNPFSPNYSFTSPDYKVDDKIYINCGNHYIDLYKINWVSANILILYPDSNHSLTKLREGLEKTAREGNATIIGDLFPNSGRSTFKLLGDLKFDDYTLSVPTRPEVGVVEVSKNGFASGENTKATATDSTSEGRDTHSVGPYGHTEGRDTVAGYAAHAQNKGTKALGHYSDAKGLDTTASGMGAEAGGCDTEASGEWSQAKGDNTRASGYASDAGGYETEALHKAGFTRGIGTRTSSDYQSVFGRYNKDNPDAIVIFGNGTSEENRSNAFEFLEDGSLILSGGFTGKIASGKYTGVWSGSAYNEVRLYFDFAPKLIIISRDPKDFSVTSYGFAVIGDGVSKARMIQANVTSPFVEGSGVFSYSDISVYNGGKTLYVNSPLLSEGGDQSYYYIAIG